MSHDSHNSRDSNTRLLIWTGLATAFAAGVPVWLDLARDPALLTTPRYAGWLAGFLVFVLVFFFSPRERAWRLGLLAVQSVTALAMIWLHQGNSLTAVLLVITAAQLREVLPLRASLVWLGIQSAVSAGIMVSSMGMLGTAVAGVFLGFQLFALYTSHVAESERQAREELARAHESLLTTRQLLAESTRAAERLRISQELHDVLGHHLTALALNLEAARHAPEEKARERVETAHRLAKGLLQEVRQVVGALRREETGGGEGGLLEGRLAAALAQLGAGLNEPRVHLSVRAETDGGDSDLTHTLMRCAQEVFTNAVRHAGARNLWLEVSGNGDGLTLHARDDGRGASAVVPGNGLQGMKERIERLGGRLEIASAPGDGFEVTAWIPRTGGAA
ncbi:MAG TPA: sensor histidine kinase [Thermoanaerobaculia bacterium]